MAIEDSLPAATPSSFALSNAMWTSNEASDEAPAPPPPPADCHHVESQDSLSAIPAEEESEEEPEDDLRKKVQLLGSRVVQASGVAPSGLWKFQFISRPL